MRNVREGIDHSFEGLAHWIFRHRLLTVLVLLGLTATLVTQLPKIRIDADTESFFHPDSPTMVAYNAFRDQFGRDELLVVAVSAPEVFDAAFLRRLKEFHGALEDEVPYLREVTSLGNARDTYGRGDELVVADLLDEVPESPEALAALREQVLSSPLYPNLLISEDGTLTTVIVETTAFSSGVGTGPDAGGTPMAGDVQAAVGNESLLGGFDEESAPTDAAASGSEALSAPQARGAPFTAEENSQVVTAVERVMERFEGPNFRLYLAGSPVVTDILKREMQSNMGRFILLAVVAIGLFLLLLFRRLSGVLLPLMVVLLSLLSTISSMAVLEVPLTLPLMILPSFLLAVGVGASVHLLAVFYRHYEEHGDREAGLTHALGHSGLPIVMTSLTTAAGLMSFLTAEFAAIGHLGMFAGLGVIIALIYTLLLIPAMVGLLPLRRHPRFAQVGGTSWVDALLTATGDFSVRRARSVVAVSVVLMVVAGAGLTQLKFSHNTLTWFPESSDIRKATNLIDEKMKGSLSLEVVVDTGQENGLYDPAVLNGIEALSAHALKYTNSKGQTFVGKTSSMVDVLKEIHQALNENRPVFYAIPQDRELIAQELLLFENSGSDDLQRMVDTRFSKARLTVKTPWDDAAVYVGFMNEIQREGEHTLGEHGSVTTTGILRLLTESINALMQSMITSYTIAAVVITLMMLLLIGRLRMGLLSMIPNLAPIFMTLGLMGWLGLPLDMFTLLIGSIALGLAVDDTIHFFHNFRRYYDETGDVSKAVHETMNSTGRAMLFTTLVLVVGFWLYMFASLNNLFNFGLLTGVALLIALLGDFMLSPAMLQLVYGRKRA